ncbi:sugar [Coprinopsis cinerea okayama7|uniref:Sugar n=1 Tax=Coprinopsis cinerea (strain Okayama-7 / 130 / ATCC MYA-4618 / FGSC 9003) TaxID=240176 RepID=D6RPD7_COPC7|nr:sugar [Coprinopsis cinerea okayama7\|eukprot:XP_002910699.1 sugar [Coprinopsis cinerea okayama7\
MDIDKQAPASPTDSLGDKVEVQEDQYHRHAHKTPEERQAALREALAVDPGPKKWGWPAIHSAAARAIAVSIARCFPLPILTNWSSMRSNDKVMGGINTMKQYQDYFGMTGVGTLSLESSPLVQYGMYNPVVTVLPRTYAPPSGMIPASYLPDRFGRRLSMFFGNAVLISSNDSRRPHSVGAVITANATTKGMFLGGRFLTGLGAACAGASAKSYLAEMAPAHLRGAYMGFLNSLYVGLVPPFHVEFLAMNQFLIRFRPSFSTATMSVRCPQLTVPAGINVLFIYLCPESPRWLYSVGKSQQARGILARLHSRTQDPNSPLINLEMEEIEEKIQVDGVDKRWWDFRPLFRTRADRYRAYMVILIGSFGEPASRTFRQLSGNGLITYFMPILLENAGIHSQDKRLTLNFVNISEVSCFAIGWQGQWWPVLKKRTGSRNDSALSGSAVIDRFGRRKILLAATGAITGILAIVTGLLSDAGELNAVRSNAGITFIFLFMVVFSFGWTPMQALYPAEVLTYEARAKGLAFLGIVAQMASLINTFGLPVALEKLTWKVYLIFLFWDIFEVVIIYLFVVETKGFTLEEIGEIFDHSHPKKYSQELLRKRKEGEKGSAQTGAA